MSSRKIEHSRDSRRPGPLSGIRVFDLTVWMVGPWASMQLGALGADVIHIERPGIPLNELGAGVPPTVDGTSAGYIAWNMNKRGLGLDLKKPEDREIALRVVSSCDVFLVNMRPGVADRLGLGYEAVSTENPGIVYCSITGWGESGPMSAKPGADVQMQAFSGFWSTNGPDGGQGEFYRHYAQLDPTAGNYAVQAILMALYQRRRTGHGAYLPISMIQSALALQTLPVSEYLQTGRLPEPSGSSSRLTAPDRAFLCQDRVFVGISVRSNEEWERFCQVLDTPDLLNEDPRYSSNESRVAHRHNLDAVLEPIFAAMPSEYWLMSLNAAGLACHYPLRFDVLRNHRQVTENSYLREVDTPGWRRLTTGGAPWSFSAHEAGWSATPTPGQHTDEILEELGISRAESTS